MSQSLWQYPLHSDRQAARFASFVTREPTPSEVDDAQPRAPAVGEAARLSECGIVVWFEEGSMAKSARKRRARRKKSANHGKRPNA